jgi:ribonuclease HII
LAESSELLDPIEGEILGIDEAGRGSLVGPLVVGAFRCSRRIAAELRGLGARDSKLLRPAVRDEVYDRLQRAGRSLSVSLSPSTVDRYVTHGRLNQLEAETFARLIRIARPEEVFVDACDPNAERFGSLVGAMCGVRTLVRASHRADVHIPVVGAASIVAKVRRDRTIDRLNRTLGPGIGSGYPSDRRTVEFVRTALASRGPNPAWLRASWSTTGRLKRELQVRTLDRYGP